MPEKRLERTREAYEPDPTGLRRLKLSIDYLERSYFHRLAERYSAPKGATVQIPLPERFRTMK